MAIISCIRNDKVNRRSSGAFAPKLPADRRYCRCASCGEYFGYWSRDLAVTVGGSS